MFFRRHRKLVIFICILMITALSGIFGFLIAESEPRIASEADEEESAVQAGADKGRITKDTVITWDYEYEMCEHHVYADATPEPDMIGLSFSQFKDAYPDITIISFSADEVVLKKRFACYCPAHFLLKRKGGRLVVYRTIAGTDKQDVYMDTEVSFDSLDKDDQEALEAGRVFGSFDDLQAYLEKING